MNEFVFIAGAVFGAIVTMVGFALGMAKSRNDR